MNGLAAPGSAGIAGPGHHRQGLAAAAAAHAAGLRPANTAAAWSADWDWWARFCAEKRFDATVVEAAVMDAYAYWLWHDHGTPSTPPGVA